MFPRRSGRTRIRSVFPGDSPRRTLDHTVAEPPKKTLKLAAIEACRYVRLKLGGAVQIRALAKCRIAINRFDQPLSNNFGVQAEEAGKFPHAFAVGQTNDDGTSIEWHPH